VAFVTESDEALDLVPPPDEDDLFNTDRALVDAVERHNAKDHLDQLSELGRLAAAPRTARWAEFVDQHPPRLRGHDPFGRRTDEVDYHPAWHRLLQAGVRAGLAGAAWAPDPAPAAHTARAAALVIWSQVDVGHLVPMSTSYAAVPTLRAEPTLLKVWLPRLSSRCYESAARPPAAKLGCLAGLAVTEVQGGSDLRGTSTRAVADGDRSGTGEDLAGYRLTGRKWFCSSPMSDAFVVLAQAPGGLTCFLVPRIRDDGSRNPWRLTRLKDTLGTRACGAAEIELDGTWGARLGEEGRGLRALTPMVSATRLDATLVSAGVIRRAVSRAVHHTRHRQAYGSALIDKPLMQNVLADLVLESEAATALAMRLAAAVDAGENDLLRAAVPVAKFWVTKRATWVVAEAMECLGGNGYVEDHGMARLFRDSPLASMWEGAGNVTSLDVLRAMTLQPRSMEVLLGEVDRARGADHRLDQAMDEVAGFLQAASREARRDPAAVEAGARWMVERLAVVLAASLLVRHAPTPVASTFLATRVAGGGGTLFGTLPVGRKTTSAIVDRHLPA
jgi:putative acyl-CoA dehydrogenase